MTLSWDDLTEREATCKHSYANGTLIFNNFNQTKIILPCCFLNNNNNLL